MQLLNVCIVDMLIQMVSNWPNTTETLCSMVITRI